MFEVFVWVPSKGWKLVLRTKNQRKAIETALEFAPLEVKLSLPNGGERFSGRCHIPLTETNLLTQIEDYAFAVGITE